MVASLGSGSDQPVKQWLPGKVEAGSRLQIVVIRRWFQQGDLRPETGVIRAAIAGINQGDQKALGIKATGLPVSVRLVPVQLEILAHFQSLQVASDAPPGCLQPGFLQGPGLEKAEWIVRLQQPFLFNGSEPACRHSGPVWPALARFQINPQGVPAGGTGGQPLAVAQGQVPALRAGGGNGPSRYRITACRSLTTGPGQGLANQPAAGQVFLAPWPFQARQGFAFIGGHPGRSLRQVPVNLVA